ncbi:ATP-dependent DNA helicase RecG [Palleronia marisminoris]|uniref:Probable DNA 3'-5' helicase RecG n=1 Tax=Palleronia marisminoris TaxID=315423 RepID=A0A1Y5TGR8_9RHOB|nr:ATP-dependent DNA helicase RecG [Palleronia marisminoris]SFH34364.1 ATP-dependent DNA helicase RecG [Palleronia marisminoris]SLN60038.1 ATP-dependent DNA helicase RecG [Palleronia marisminoris]
MSRPQALWPLFSDLTVLPGVGPKGARIFAQMKIATPRDLIFTLPHAGIDRRRQESIRDVELPGTVTVEVTVGRHRPAAGRGPARVEVEDARTSFLLIFFHARGDWLTRMLPEGQRRIVSGRVELFDGIAQMAHPDYILHTNEADTLPRYEPVYPLTNGLTQRGMAKAVAGAIGLAPELPEWIDPGVIAAEGWSDWRRALATAHAPDADSDLATVAPARRRLAYDELFAHQLTLALVRADRRRKVGRVSRPSGRLSSRVRAGLPYSLTGAQERAIAEIAEDMASPHRMGRLLQGDVGSGKTLVAFMALLAAVEAGGQGAMMAPTEILARQHLESLTPLAEQAGVVIEILTGRDKGAERAAKLAALQNGDIHILVGTHAVFSDDVHFADLRLAIVDEQHRFGVSQRLALGQKGERVDTLVMTATPIPRSLSLAQYGHMDVSILDEKPPGRTPVKTALVAAARYDEVVERLRAALKEGRQAYWVCPLVAESEVSDLTSAEDRFRRLRAALGEGQVDLVHGQMPPTEKDAAMAKFAAGETGVLVATTVIEVGVNVPNASIMVIERAETFGLAQLHQLRGRVGRGAAASTCLLMFGAELSETARKRLEILRDTEDGFHIAEADLAMRGAGDVLGQAQSGLPRFRIADLERQAALQATARRDAQRLLEADPDLSSPRGMAARTLLWLMEQDKAIQMIGAG